MTSYIMKRCQVKLLHTALCLLPVWLTMAHRQCIQFLNCFILYIIEKLVYTVERNREILSCGGTWLQYESQNPTFYFSDERIFSKELYLISFPTFKTPVTVFVRFKKYTPTHTRVGNHYYLIFVRKVERRLII